MTFLPIVDATRIIMDSVADGIFTVDDGWRITSFNRAAEQITGVSQQVAIGRPCREIFQASICDGQCALRRTRESGCPIIDLPIFINDARNRRVPISISTAVLRDAEGRVWGGVETFRDLSSVGARATPSSAMAGVDQIVGRSEPMQRLFARLPRLAESPSTVLILGASGTGKELFARALHELSPRKQERFVAVNCSALPDTLLESELFGYRAGAFTDARRDKPGRFELANRGTLFLDEIGDITPAMQVRLLRVLQERVIEPLGAVEPLEVDVRVVAATNKDLSQLVRQGAFREDLFYRINVVRLDLPTLRERREDIPLLAEHLIAKFNRRQGKRVVGLSDEVWALLLMHDFPGNVRELENIIEHAFVLCSGGIIEARHLPASLRPSAGGSCEACTLAHVEALQIQRALQRHQGHRAATARELGIHEATLYRKMKRFGLRDELSDQERS